MQHIKTLHILSSFPSSLFHVATNFPNSDICDSCHLQRWQHPVGQEELKLWEWRGPVQETVGSSQLSESLKAGGQSFGAKESSKFVGPCD